MTGRIDGSTYILDDFFIFLPLQFERINFIVNGFVAPTTFLVLTANRRPLNMS